MVFSKVPNIMFTWLLYGCTSVSILSIRKSIKEVHEQGSEDVDDLVQLVPDIHLLDQRKDPLHERAKQHSDLLAILQQLDDHLRFLPKRRSHFFRHVLNTL